MARQQAYSRQKAYAPSFANVGWTGLEHLAWREGALCAQVDPEVWFPRKGISSRRARNICAECPVRQECLSEALSQDSRHGMWGGLSERARRPLHAAVTKGADPEDVALVALYGQEALRRWTA